MKKILSTTGATLFNAHNDLLCKNIIYNEKQGRYLTLAVSKVFFFLCVYNSPLILVSINKFNSNVRVKNMYED